MSVVEKEYSNWPWMKKGIFEVDGLLSDNDVISWGIEIKILPSRKKFKNGN